jgi:hypothetical protein
MFKYPHLWIQTTDEELSMNRTQIFGAAIALTCGSTLFAGDVVDLQPGDFTNELSGIMNTQLSELIGATEFESTDSFEIWSEPQGAGKGGAELLYQASFMTRIVRSNESGNLHFNYRIVTPNADLTGMVSRVEISGFAGLQTRVEYRNELTAPGADGPVAADRSIDGDILNFDFGANLETSEESKFFFAMLDTDTFLGGGENAGIGPVATVYLLSGEAVSFNVAGPIVPSPGAISLLSIAGLITVRRRR